MELGRRWHCDGMGMAKKIAALGIAKKVYDEARKPHNQAKIRQAVQKGFGESAGIKAAQPLQTLHPQPHCQRNMTPVTRLLSFLFIRGATWIPDETP